MVLKTTLLIKWNQRRWNINGVLYDSSFFVVLWLYPSTRRCKVWERVCR